MAFTWHVQPYRWLYEMRAQYTTTVITATRKKAQQYAGEATAWMKQHAPWQDDTERARAGLRAFVVGNKDEERAYTEGLRMAQRDDKQELKRINQEIRSKKAEAERRQIDYMTRTGEVRPSRVPAPYRFDSGAKKFQPKTQVPRSRSAVSAFEKEFNRSRLPIVDIRFTHNTELAYVIWLEVARGGRYSIIGPAMDYWGKRFMAEVRSIANLKQYRNSNLVVNEMGPEEAFQRHVERRTAVLRSERKPDYEPWSNAKKAERKRRRPEYQRRKARLEAMTDDELADYEEMREASKRSSTISGAEAKRLAGEVNRLEAERNAALRRRGEVERFSTFTPTIRSR